MASRLAPTSGPLHSSPLLSALAQLLPQDPGTVLPGPESQLHQLRDWVPQFPHHKIKTVLGPSREDSCRCEPTNTCLVLAQALAHWPLTQFRTTPTGRCFPPCLHCSALTTHFSGAPAPTPPPAPHTPELTELPSPSPRRLVPGPPLPPRGHSRYFPKAPRGPFFPAHLGTGSSPGSRHPGRQWCKADQVAPSAEVPPAWTRLPGESSPGGGRESHRNVSCLGAFAHVATDIFVPPHSAAGAPGNLSDALSYLVGEQVRALTRPGLSSRRGSGPLL